ncbi:MAG TPA: hypothetical protein VMT51_09945 [Dongiaceae bacterium]|nr:hypothetical protein [Dongiaceae bacterium]
MKHPSEEELFAYREGEMKDRGALAAHLAGCAECSAQLEKLEAVFAALDGIAVPDPGQDYGARVWRQIAERLPQKRQNWWASLLQPQRLLAVGCAAALLLAAFWAGRVTKKPNAPAEAAADAGQVRERVLVVAVGEHLGKSEMVLVELSNRNADTQGNKLINISSEQRRAENLLEENRLYRQTALEGGDNAIASTLNELERVLLDVANSPAEITPAQFASIQKRIAAQGILLKVRVVRQGLRDEATGRKQPLEGQPGGTKSDSNAKARNKA